MISKEKRDDENMENIVVDKDRRAKGLSCRVVLALIGFLGTLNLYALRINMSMAIVCMVNHTAVAVIDGGVSKNSNATECGVSSNITSRLEGQFIWSKGTRGIILGSFFWGYLATQLPAAFLCHKFGPRRVMAVFMLIAAVATLLTPLAAHAHIAFLIILRILVGVGSGVWFPGFHQLWSHWAPPLERSKLVGFSYAGAQIGNIITLPISSLLCTTSAGWSSIFYLFGSLGVLLCIAWILLVADRPSQHPRISKKELTFLSNELRGQVEVNHKKGSSRFPFKAVLTSLPIWAIVVANVTWDWGGYTFLTMLPTYLDEVLGFNEASNGLFSALPYIGFWIVQMFAAWVGDALQVSQLLSTGSVRKVMQSISMLVPALLVVIIGFLSCENGLLALILLIVGVAAKGCAYIGVVVNPVDVAPQYAGIIFAWSNSIAASTGFFSPLVVGAITQKGSREEWRLAFFITAIIYVVGAVFYMIFASGELQPWAIIEEDRAKPEDDLVVMTSLMESAENSNRSDQPVNTISEIDELLSRENKVNV